jgi:mRNA-degrading endonuclease RelE of RelBE toxin-antitoxin system
MGTSPNSNVRTADFREQYDRLPDDIKKLAKAAFKRFCENPAHPSLRLHELKDLKRGHHRRNSFSVSITMHYRAIYAVDDTENVWYWIGTHADYDVFVGKK